MTKVLYVAWQDPQDRQWYPVGQLTHDGRLYSFVYTRGAQRSPRFLPFGPMRQLDVVYESEELFPLFANRLLSQGRPEYKDFVDWLNLPETEKDPLAMLARSGGARETDSLVVFSRAERSATGDYQAKFFAHGLRYLPDEAIQVVNRLPARSRLFLMPDPQNEHDRFAIALRTGDPKTLVGYCPRYLTADFHTLLNANARAIDVTAERVNPHAPIQLRLLCAVTAPWPRGFEPYAEEDFRVLASGLPRLSQTAAS